MDSYKFKALYTSLFVGTETKVPVLDGSYRRYINLDNAASTPALHSVVDAVNQFMSFYSSVHRGTGFKSQYSTHLYEEARRTVLAFVSADPSTHICIFSKNTTEAINKLSKRFPFSQEKNVVLTSGLEHHSNDLPWRAVALTIHIRLTPEGQLDENDFDRKLAEFEGRVALVSISGASNVTGFINPIHRLAEKAHAAGAQILVDCAQLAPHRKIDMLQLTDPKHLDYLAISAHKMYAPFGTGALIARRDTFENGEPDQRGGGTVEIVTLDDVIWAQPPDREEAGSPNTVGAIALAAAIQQLKTIGMEKIAEHEAELTAYALQRLRAVPGIKIFGDSNPSYAPRRVGVIPFNIEGISHFKVAAVLGYEFGIGVRNGCFCAHPYILHLLKVNQAEADHVRNDILGGDRREVPGLIRISFGLYNNIEDIDLVVEALTRVARGNYIGEYIQDPATGEFHPKDWEFDFNSYTNILK